MGTIEEKQKEYLFHDMIYVKCSKCNTLQLKQLIPLDILYQSNHNVDIVGEIWKKHYEELSKFIIESTLHKNILEVGDPSAKLPKLCNDFESWSIVEPNPHIEINDKRISFVDSWIENYRINNNIDTVVMSHVFEHLYNPRKILSNLFYNAKKGTKLIISIPNFMHITKQEILPPAGLHFEHSFYIDDDNVHEMLSNLGFSIVSYKRFQDHSIFYCYEYTSKKINFVDRYSQFRKNLLLDKTLKKYENLIKKINNSKDKDLFIYGAHFPAQLLFAMGLDRTKFINCIDNSRNKTYRYLYGYDLFVIPPQDLSGMTKPKILCEMGIYTEEIKKNLLLFNGEIEFICAAQ